MVSGLLTRQIKENTCGIQQLILGSRFRSVWINLTMYREDASCFFIHFIVSRFPSRKRCLLAWSTLNCTHVRCTYAVPTFLNINMSRCRECSYTKCLWLAWMENNLETDPLTAASTLSYPSLFTMNFYSHSKCKKDRNIVTESIRFIWRYKCWRSVLLFFLFKERKNIHWEKKSTQLLILLLNVLISVSIYKLITTSKIQL